MCVELKECYKCPVKKLNPYKDNPWNTYKECPYECAYRREWEKSKWEEKGKRKEG